MKVIQDRIEKLELIVESWLGAEIRKIFECGTYDGNAIVVVVTSKSNKLSEL